MNLIQQIIRKKYFALKPLRIFVIIVLIIVCNRIARNLFPPVAAKIEASGGVIERLPPKRDIIENARKCYIKILDMWKECTTNCWVEIPEYLVRHCGNKITDTLPFVETAPTLQEHKYYMIPRVPYINDSCSVITFGVGGLIHDEQHIKTSLPKCTFLGFDPNQDYRKLFEEGLGGKFVHTAVNGKSGFSTIFKLGKMRMNKTGTPARAAAELIKTYHGKDKLVDILNIDVEGSEYSIFEQIVEDPIFENVCQFNVELHPVWYHDTGYSFYDVIEIFKKLMEKQTFIWVQTVVHTSYFFPSYFVNIKNELCIEKYLQNWLSFQ